MSKSPPLQVSHETFVPREIIYDLWTAVEHLRYWNPKLAAAALVTAKPSERLTYRVTGSAGQAAELDVTLTDLGGTTRIDVTQSSTGHPDLPNSADAWHDMFRAMENYLSAI